MAPALLFSADAVVTFLLVIVPDSCMGVAAVFFGMKVMILVRSFCAGLLTKRIDLSSLESIRSPSCIPLSNLAF